MAAYRRVYDSRHLHGIEYGLSLLFYSSIEFCMLSEPPLQRLVAMGARRIKLGTQPQKISCFFTPENCPHPSLLDCFQRHWLSVANAVQIY